MLWIKKCRNLRINIFPYHSKYITYAENIKLPLLRSLVSLAFVEKIIRENITV